MVNKKALFKKLARYLLWYGAIVIAIHMLGKLESFSLIHHLGLIASIVVIDYTYSKRHKIVNFDKEDDDEE